MSHSIKCQLFCVKPPYPQISNLNPVRRYLVSQLAPFVVDFAS